MNKTADVLSNCVQDMRLARGFTQEELGAKIGVTRQTIIAIEKGNYTPSIVLCLKLATLFKVPVEKLFYL
jgi:putative transcriptional regulator